MMSSTLEPPSSKSSWFSWAAPIAETLNVYQTAKIVQLKDKRLGYLYYSLIFLILLFVVGYEILYSNDQFDKRDVTGTPLMNIQQPTLNSCNPGHDDCESDFTPLGDLPYCQVYQGNSTSVPQADRRPCFYADHHTLVPTSTNGGSLFIPTRIDKRTEVRDCVPAASNNYTCRNEFRIVNHSGVMYIADIERYTLLIAHSYQRDTVSGNNNNLEGSYLECDRRKKDNAFVGAITRAIFGATECPGGYWRRKIACILDDCGRDAASRKKKSLLANLMQYGTDHRHGRQRTRGRRVAFARDRGGGYGEVMLEVSSMGTAPKVDHDAFAIPDGDVFSLSKLLSLAGVSLDATHNLDGDPLREAGTVLDIEVIYNNLHSFSSTFGNTRVEYWYKIAVRPMHQVKEEVVQWVDANADKRIIQNRHGIDIVVKVSGTFGFFSIMNLMLMLTTASAMLAVATVLTDKLAMYAMADRDFYSAKKYEIANAHKEQEATEA